MSIVLKTPSNGSVTLAEQDTASDVTVTIPAATATMLTTATAGVPIGGPAFRAYKNTPQAVSDAVGTKVTFTIEDFDTASAYNAATSRFQPTVAGYYQIIANVYGSSNTSLSYNYIQIYKNTVINAGVVVSPYLGNTALGQATALIYLNGSTDYVEIYVSLGGTGSLNVIADTQFTFFSAALVRSAT